MIDRLLSAAGIDPIQWRALTRTYLLMDRRSSGGARRASHTSAGNAFLSKPLLILMTINGVMLGALAVATRDAFTAAALAVTYVALTIALMVLLEFTGVVISPDDYWIVGSRPVDSRTYFAARLASVLAYVILLAAIMAVLPALVLAIWHRGGVLTGAGTFLSIVACATTTSVLTIATYAALVTRVHPRRVARALNTVQLLAPTLLLGGYALVMHASQQSRAIDIRVADIAWVWAIPSMWFAAIVPALQGTAGGREWTAIAGAALLTLAAIPAAAGRFSIGFAERLADSSASADAAGSRSSRAIPGFRRAEAYAVATLIRAQFRYDTRFRLAILTIIPITAFYLFLGMDEGVLGDPFTGAAPRGGTPMYFVIAFVPMSLHGNLQYSESWRAAWIFLSTPADAARLAVAAKNFVTVFFLGGYLLALAILWSFFYERVWHAFLHAAIFGALAHFLLQAAVILHPVLPFTAEPKRAQRSSQLMWLFGIGSLVASIAPLALPRIYRSATATAGLIAVLLVVTAALEVVGRRRAREAVLDLEL